MKRRNIRVLIADDHSIVRRGLALLRKLAEPNY